jgi:hypothetical protein
LKAIKIELPRIYLNEGGKYPQHLGKPKVSYSQIGSFKDYKMGYLRDYILDMRSNEDGIFAEYGKMIGEYLSDRIRHEYLDNDDVKVLDSLEKQEGAIFESEIVIDRGHYVIQGFSDKEFFIDNLLFIEDFKTGNSDDMLKKYGDLKKYYQTRLYAYQRENEGSKIGGCCVVHLGRKGNSLERGKVHEKTKNRLDLRLSGQIDNIWTPYVRQNIEDYLKEIDMVILEIAEYYRVHKENFAKSFKTVEY